MVIQFPNNPTLNNTYTYNSITRTYNGKGWTKSSGGGDVSSAGSNGTANTGGVGSWDGGDYGSGTGGSDIVIVRYRSS